VIGNAGGCSIREERLANNDRMFNNSYSSVALEYLIHNAGVTSQFHNGTHAEQHCELYIGDPLKHNQARG